jgi:hypothetical protein
MNNIILWKWRPKMTSLSLQSFCRAHKLIWVRKPLDDTNWSDWKTFLLSVTEKHWRNYIWQTTDQQPYFLKDLNAFWKDVYNAWHTLSNTDINYQPLTRPLFHNNNIRINNMTIFNREWLLHGAKYIHDIIDGNGNFYTWEQFSAIYNMIDQPFKYISLIHSI